MEKPDFMERMKQHWLATWYNDLEAKGDPLPFFDLLVAFYSQPHRKYHNLFHIENCLIELAKFRLINSLIKHAGCGAAALAIWLHDVIYDTDISNPYNEIRSAELAKGIVRCAWVPNAFFEHTVANAIIATDHKYLVEGFCNQLTCDIDLTSLGAPWEAFEENGRKIRFEYKHVPEDIFLKERKRILKSFLDRENIYYLPYFRNKYEAQARRNLTRALEQLSSHS